MEVSFQDDGMIIRKHRSIGEGIKIKPEFFTSGVAEPSFYESCGHLTDTFWANVKQKCQKKDDEETETHADDEEVTGQVGQILS